jgi:hypothetical protein
MEKMLEEEKNYLNQEKQKMVTEMTKAKEQAENMTE